MLDVVVICGTNAVSYIEFLIWSCRLTASNFDALRFIVGINDKDADLIRLEKLKNNCNIKLVDAYSDEPNGSMSHGIALNKTFEHVESENVLFCDADVAFVQSEWDLMYQNALSDKIVAIGTAYPTDYAANSAAQKYVEFPNVIGSMFRTELLRRLRIDFCPAKQSSIKTDDEALAFKLPIGTLIARDTGWQLTKLRQAGYESIAMAEYQSNDSEAVLLTNPNIRGSEYHLNSVPLISHMGRSILRPFGQHEFAIAWEQRCRDWIYKQYEQIQVKRSNVKLNVHRGNEHWTSIFDAVIRPHVDINNIHNAVCMGVRNSDEVDAFARQLRNATCIGIELNPAAASRNVLTHDFAKLPVDMQGQFDLIFSNSIDHSFDIAVTLREWRRAASDNCRLVVQFSTDHVCTTDPYNFTIARATALVEDAGFNIIAIYDPMKTWKEFTIVFKPRL